MNDAALKDPLLKESAQQDELWHDAFYHFVNVEEPETVVTALTDLCEASELLGNIIVAREGVNGMLAGTEAKLSGVRDWFANDERFSAMMFKRTRTSFMPFRHLRIRAKPEIVTLGLPSVDAVSHRGIDLSPEAWRDLLEEDDVVLIDNRNRFEYVLGHFKGAIDPGVHNFSEFAAYAEAHLDEWQDKKVAMYCTGGIRCEKTSAWLKTKGLEVYQLEGGIINYFAQIPDAEQDYEGECFVFDRRVTLNTRLEETDTTLDEVTELQIRLESAT